VFCLHRPPRTSRRHHAVGSVCAQDRVATCTDAHIVEKIKKSLIDKAKIKKQYAKLKAREDTEATAPNLRQSPAWSPTLTESPCWKSGRLNHKLPDI